MSDVERVVQDIEQAFAVYLREKTEMARLLMGGEPPDGEPLDFFAAHARIDARMRTLMRLHRQLVIAVRRLDAPAVRAQIAAMAPRDLALFATLAHPRLAPSPPDAAGAAAWRRSILAARRRHLLRDAPDGADEMAAAGLAALLRMAE